jgi:glycosyltransferase involved in cell wall biosynthesis
MKILYHHRTLGDGAEGIHVREMVRAFRSLGHEVKVIGPAGETPPEKSKNFRLLDRLRRLIPSALYELLEMGYAPYIYFKVAREVGRYKPDFIYDRYITFNSGVVRAARRLGVPLCLEVNAPLAYERTGEQDERLVFRRMAARLETWIPTHADHTVVVSTPLKQYLESVGVPKDKCIVMPNGVDPERFRPKEKDDELQRSVGIPASAFVIGFTGILRPWHGLDLLLEAFDHLVRKGLDVALLIVGDGPYRPTIERIASERGLSNKVFITGRVPHARVPDYVALFDAAVSPRATFYASPMKVIEYMALGKPVVVPGTQNFLDIVDDGANGVTFKDGDAANMAQALASLYGKREHCVELGRRARQKVETRLNWEWNAREVCKLFAAEPAGTFVALERCLSVTARED